MRRVSIALLTMALQAQGHDAISLNASQIGIITESVHQKARIIDIKTDKLKQNLNAGKIIVCCRISSITQEGEITTLGRGGSDTSALALAASLNAKRCDITTEVEGFIQQIQEPFQRFKARRYFSYDEMLELARVGANVLHPRSVENSQTI